MHHLEDLIEPAAGDDLHTAASYKWPKPVRQRLRKLTHIVNNRDTKLSLLEDAEVATTCDTVLTYICAKKKAHDEYPVSDPQLSTILIMSATQLVEIQLAFSQGSVSTNQGPTASKWTYENIGISRTVTLMFAIAAIASPYTGQNPKDAMDVLRGWSATSISQRTQSPTAVVAAANRLVNHLLMSNRYSAEPLHENNFQNTLSLCAFGGITAALAAIQVNRQNEICIRGQSCSSLTHSFAIQQCLDAASGDAGFTTLRDLLLSFCSDFQYVGLRSTLMLPQERQEALRENTPDILRSTHCKSSMGCSTLYRESECELDQICCILSGCAMMLQKNIESTPFGGVIGLPFLAGHSHAHKLSLVGNTWIGQTHSYGEGLQGLLKGLTQTQILQ